MAQLRVPCQKVAHNIPDLLLGDPRNHAGAMTAHDIASLQHVSYRNSVRVKCLSIGRSHSVQAVTVQKALTCICR